MTERKAMAQNASLLLAGLRYEQWLRFCFMEDDGEDGAKITVPAEAAARSRREEPEMALLLDMLDGKDVSLEHSRSALYAWLEAQAGKGGAGAAGALAEISSDDACRREMDLYSGWIQALADGGAAMPGRENEAPSFREWESAFAAWKESLDARAG